ncbi:hypothetical protein QZH41_010560 [Actinostola sp. cb2023]|nr:hypothetical protein QZH41_010560 [Actinostola sp. cb2023]
MDHMEPPIKRSKVESGGVEAEPNSQVSKESGNALKKDEPKDNHGQDELTNNHIMTKTITKMSIGNSENSTPNGLTMDLPNLPIQVPNEVAVDKEPTPKPPINVVNNSKGNQEITVKKENKTMGDGNDPDDPIAGLDWKDGIATLPGSDLKFKMTEFGTLEILQSTVETDKGGCEWSTSTNKAIIKQESTTSSPAKSNETSTQVSVIKKSQEDFSASGRFCSLKCVGMYTGRRNKGREFVRHVKTLDGKIIKKRKKKTAPVSDTSAEGESSQSNVVAKTEQDATNKAASDLITIKKIKGTKKKMKRIQLDAASLASTDNVPYDSSKPFVWVDYLLACNSKAVPVSVFQQENPELNMFPKACPEFIRGMKLEAIDPRHPSYICVCTVVRVRGARLRLHFDGWSESYDFWTNADSPFIFPVGWCDKNDRTLSAPRGIPKSEFSYQSYLEDQTAEAVPSYLFKTVSHTRHGFEVGMKLEAIDRKNPDLICVATVTNVIGNRFLVHFDEWDDTYDYWCEEDCPYIHPVGWCEAHGGKLNPPNDDEVDTFTWAEYLKTTGAVAAPPELFKKRFPPGYKIGQKLEAVDKRNPSLVRAASVVYVEEYKVKLHFDGWDDTYDEWYDADSTDLHPVSSCEKTCHPLEPPLTRADKISSAACPTPGCKGIGHVKGAKYSSHHSTFGCPYSLQNLNKESCLVDRLSTNSMTEESDWSYGKRDKPLRDFKEDDPSSPTDAASPTPSCDNNSTGHWKTKPSSSAGPISDTPTNKRTSHRSSSSYSSAKMTSTTNTSTMTSNHHSTSNTVRINARRHSFKEEKPVPARTKLVEKGIQYVSPYYTSWGYGFTKLPVNGRRDYYYPLHDETPSKEKVAMGKWTMEQVETHVTSLGCTEQAKLFGQQEIDGEAFLLLTQSDIVTIMNIKLGPALKIFNSIPKH